LAGSAGYASRPSEDPGWHGSRTQRCETADLEKYSKRRHGAGGPRVRSEYAFESDGGLGSDITVNGQADEKTQDAIRAAAEHLALGGTV